MSRLLSDEEITKELSGTRGWTKDGAAISKVYKFKEFADGIKFVNSVADLAESLDHHPDIQVAYTTVTLRIWTHSMGGVTDRDFKLAREIDKVRG